MRNGGNGDPIPKRALRGAVAGLAATGVMTAARLGADHVGLVAQRPAHAEVVGRLRAATGRPMWGHEAETLVTIAHYGFGAVAGAVYAAVVPRRVRPASGVLYASAIWALSFQHLLPRLRLMPKPRHDDNGRQIVLAVDHVIYGAVLDGCLEALERRGPLRKLG